MNIRAAGFYADLANDGDRHVAQFLIFAIGQRLRGGDGDRIAGVHTHRIKIFDGANDDHVVSEVAHDFQFKFFPAQDRFFDQHFMNRRGGEAVAHNLFKLFRVKSRAGARAAEGERRANNCGIARFCHDYFSVRP